MTRNDDLVRELLIHIEENDRLHASAFEADRKTILYHVEILIEAGYVLGQVDSSESGERLAAFIKRLTWEGHEFLDDVRSDTVWNETKKRVTSGVGSASLAVVQDVAKRVLSEML